MEEKKLTDEEIVKALEYSNAVLVKQLDDLKERYVQMLKDCIESNKIASEKAVKDTAKECLNDIESCIT